MAQAPQVSGWGFTAPDWGGYNIMKKDEQSAYQKAQDYSTNMSNTAWQRGVQDMKDAGLNPMLAVSQGPASSPQGTKMQIHNPPGISANSQLQTAAQVRNLDADSELKLAQAREVAPTAGVQREFTAHGSANIRQQIEESKERVEKLLMEQVHLTASAENMQQQTKNLQTVIPNLKETLQLLKAQTGEARQRVQALLPSLEADIKKLERLFMQMQLPGRQTDEAFQDSATGAVLRNIKETLKDLMPGFGLIIPSRKK